MKVQVNECDACGKRCDNHYWQKDWIHLESPSSISVSIGTGKGNNTGAQTFFRNHISDFCGWKCFQKYMADSINAGPEPVEKETK